jgi:hypothetical protein
MIKNIIAIKSIFNNNNKPVALQKTNIKKTTEWIGFFDEITITADIKAKNENKFNNNDCIILYSVFHIPHTFPLCFHFLLSFFVMKVLATNESLEESLEESKVMNVEYL